MTHLTERRHEVVLVASLNKFSYHNEIIPERAIDLLDAFFQVMLPVIDTSGGTVYDMVGHQLLASFNISNDDISTACFLAVEAGLKMQQVFKLLEPGWQECGFEAQMGIGIHHGMVKIQREERDYYSVDVIMGMVVDSARGLAEQNGAMFVSENTFQQIRPLTNELFQASKLWVSSVRDGIIAYQLTPLPNALQTAPLLVGDCQILIAEDNVDLSAIFSTVLRRAGFSVNVARNGHETMQFLNRALPDLLLLDINMPGPSGLEIIRHVRETQKNIYIIVITANHQARRSIEADMADLFLHKPISITDLVQLAHRFVKMH